ncbi:MAG TPA: putative Ig domain-containing protein, partial [Anaerolineales bacterium]|nr:putative Ig domain-containing protein [Anaerolineales bacterium]
TGFVTQPFNYPVTVVGTLPISISTSELPDNLTLSSGVITGIPVIPGTFDITLTATNSIGQDVEHLSLTILDISTFLNVYLPIIQH